MVFRARRVLHGHVSRFQYFVEMVSNVIFVLVFLFESHMQQFCRVALRGSSRKNMSEGTSVHLDETVGEHLGENLVKSRMETL